MWIGNAMLVVLNLPLIGIWIKLLRVPYRVLYPAILLFCFIGVFTINNTNFDIMQTVALGFLGVVFVKLECDPAPLLLGCVLGPIMEENLRRAAAVVWRSNGLHDASSLAHHAFALPRIVALDRGAESPQGAR